MKFLCCLWLVGCGAGEDCGVAASCPSGSYQLCSAGAQSCYYRTSDGRRLMEACPSGSGSYQACSSSDGSGCGFHTSDGTVFSCVSCGDCTAAATQASSWCGQVSPATPDLAGPPSACGHPGDRGNSKGVGQYCLTGADCTGAAHLCSSVGNTSGVGSYFCTLLCDANQPGQCGEDASCVCGSSCACIPTACH